MAARIIADRLRSRHGVNLIVDNRPGASGRLAVDFVKGGDADGQTMLFTPDFVMTVYPHSFRKLGYDPLKDFAPVALCAKTAYVLCAGPALPANVTDMQQFLAWTRSNPKLAAFASTSPGSTTHFTGVMLARAAGVEMLHVPYKGGAPALQDLMGGQIPLSINPIGEVLPHLKAGKLRVLATTGARRSRFMPDVPTLFESGFKDVIVEGWLGMLMPAKVAANMVKTTSAAINAVLQEQDVKDSFARLALETVQSTPDDFRAVIRSDLEKWGPAVAASGFAADE